MAGILNAFHSKIALNVSIDHVIKLCINSVIEYENYINSELSRLYKNNQMIQGLGMTYEVLELALKQICNNNSLITRAVQYAKDTYQDRLIDLIGVAGIVRKFKLFEIDTYSSYYIKSEWEQSSSENESEDSSLSHESLENSNEFTAIKDHIFKPSITP